MNRPSTPWSLIAWTVTGPALPTLETDFSRYAMGSRDRTLNFLPTNPYGLIATVPEETRLDESPFFQRMLITDGEVFYDDQGAAISAVDFKEFALEALEDSATRLPVRVEGAVAWTAVRLDPTHVRVTLIDSGYVSPADRQASIVFQHLQGAKCTDILSGERLAVLGNTVTLTIPAGVLRVIDITHH